MTEEEFLFAHIKCDYSDHYLKELAPHLRDAGILVLDDTPYSNSTTEMYRLTKFVQTKVSRLHKGEHVALRCLMNEMDCGK